MKRVIVLLAGRVQAVGFRDRVVEIAVRCPVAGTVRNLPDGTLEIDVEGNDAAVDAFIGDVLANPPRHARIERYEQRPAEPRGAVGFARARYA